MTEEKDLPTMPESAFIYCNNYNKIDLAIKILSGIIPCDLINSKEIEDEITYLRTLHKELCDAFDVLAEEQYTAPILNEETMGDDHADEEGDAQQEKPIDFRGVD